MRSYYRTGGQVKRRKAGKPKSGGKICPSGKAWAKRTFDTYPSAYAKTKKGGRRRITKTGRV